jgi:hypothetical protein
MLVRVVLVVALGLAAAGCGGGSNSSNPESATESSATGVASTEVATTSASEDATTAATAESALSANDCGTLAALLGDIKIDTHTDWNFAYDIFPADYEHDVALLGSLSGRMPSGAAQDGAQEVRSFLDAYSSAAQSAGVATGTLPASQDQASTIWQSVNGAGVDSIQLRITMRTLASWAAAGCRGDLSPSAATTTMSTPEQPAAPPPPTNPLAKASSEAALGDVVDAVTDAVNEAEHRRTEEELGSAPLGSEVRNCRKVRNLSQQALIGAGGAGYICEIWYEDERWGDGPAIINPQGKVVTRP